MRRILLAATLLAAGCGKTPQQAKKNDAPSQSKPVEYFDVDPTTAGAISGKVEFRGAKPARQPISMEAEEGCQKANAGHPVYDESVLVGTHSGLKNAFVYIQSGLGDKKFAPTNEGVVLDQRGCMFVPRVIGIRPGETLDLKNGDSVAHNIHPMPANNREWNQEQPPHAPDAAHRFARPEVMIPVKCNIHAWMHAWIGVVDHPYFAVTSTDGSFEWKNVPPGDYTIAVWHEKLGEQKQQVHLGASGSAAVNFTYENR